MRHAEAIAESGICIALGGLFLLAGLAKLRQPYEFLSSVYAYRLVGPSVGVAVAMVLPWVEAIVGIVLLGGVMRGGGLFIAAFLAAGFVLAQGSVIFRGLAVNCGCFGSHSQIDEMTLVRTAVLLYPSGEPRGSERTAEHDGRSAG